MRGVDRPAREVVPSPWLQMLKAARKNLRRVHDLTVHQFYRELAQLGGFLGRRSDGEPGWITIWRGWEKLNTLVRGARLAIKLNKCGLTTRALPQATVKKAVGQIINVLSPYDVKPSQPNRGYPSTPLASQRPS